MGGLTTYPSKEHPVMRGDNAGMVGIAKSANSLMEYMKSPRSDFEARFLDCHDWTKKWVGRIKFIYQRLHASGVPGVGCNTPQMYQLQIGVLRRDGASEGEHVALLVVLPSGCLLIDHTHQQFGLPIGVHGDRNQVRDHFQAVWNDLHTHIVSHPKVEGAVVRWVAFLQRKQYVLQVFLDDIRYLPDNHEFNSAAAIAAELRRERRG